MPPFARGERIRVIEDNGRTGIVGYEGVVDQVTQTGIVVILDDDPARHFRINMMGGFAKPTVAIRRFFMLGQIEKIR